MSVRLFVGNLPYQATEDEVRAHFAQVAPPVRVAIPVDRDTGRPRGFAFIEYAESSHAAEAIRQLNDRPFMGRNLAVNEARAREDRGPSGPRPPMAPRSPMGGGAVPRGGDSGPAEQAPGRGFGAPTRRARGGSAGRRDRDERKPAGPIPVKLTGRVYDVADPDESDDEPLEDFDNFATSLPKDDEPDTDKD